MVFNTTSNHEAITVLPSHTPTTKFFFFFKDCFLVRHLVRHRFSVETNLIIFSGLWDTDCHNTSLLETYSSYHIIFHKCTKTTVLGTENTYQQVKLDKTHLPMEISKSLASQYSCVATMAYSLAFYSSNNAKLIQIHI